MIKKTVLALAFFVATAFQAAAQFQIGANLGASASSTNLNPAGREINPIGGFYPELMAGYVFNPYLSASMGVGYVQRGFKQAPYGGFEQSVRLRYLTLPVYATAAHRVYKKLSAGMSMGVQFSKKNLSDGEPPYRVDISKLNSPVGFLCGAHVGYDLCKDFKLNLQYRLVSDFGYADDWKDLGRLHSHFFTLGVSYAVSAQKAEGKKAETTLASLW